MRLLKYMYILGDIKKEMKNLAHGNCYILLSNSQTALPHVLGKETGTSWNAQLELLAFSESGTLSVMVMEILLSSCRAGSTCKHLGENIHLCGH